MKKLTREEFVDRSEALFRARKIFVDSGVVKNLTVAFEVYQELLAEQVRRLELTSVNGRRPFTFLDKYVRPVCPDCKAELLLAPIKTPKGKANRYGYRTLWVCENDDCLYEKYSMDSIYEITKGLRIKPTDFEKGE